MNVFYSAYRRGFADAMSSAGIRIDGTLEKRASMFNFSDDRGGGSGFSLKSLILPLLLAAGVGYVAYNAGSKGSRKRSAVSNIKNYIAGNLDNSMRHASPPELMIPSDKIKP